MKETHLAVATNSDLIRIYDLNRFSTTLLQGHQDVVLCLAKNPEGTILVSGSKDKTARIWRASSSDSANVIEGVNEDDWECIGIAEGHVESIGAVAISKKASDVGGNFLITASQDRTAKIWDLAAVLSASASGEQGLAKLRSLTTLKIHDKDINALDISPNSLLLASASQDRTAKLFSIVYTPSSSNGTIVATASMKCLGTFKGHKRGVWSVKFSNVDRCVATGSGDRTVKLWSLEDFTCLKVSPPSVFPLSVLSSPFCPLLLVMARFPSLLLWLSAVLMRLVRCDRRSKDIRIQSCELISLRKECNSFLARLMDWSRCGTSRTKNVRRR